VIALVDASALELEFVLLLVSAGIRQFFIDC
jgi:hypothetical protein